MTFRRFIRRFRISTAAAVTVEWVVLTAFVVGLGFAVGGPLADSVTDLAASISVFIETGGPL